MKVFISGQTATATVITDDELFCLHRDESGNIVRQPYAPPPQLAGATDTVLVESPTLEEVQQRLDAMWKQDRGVRLTLIALDPTEDHETRTLAVEYVNELVSTKNILENVANRLFASPISETADFTTPLEISESNRYSATLLLFTQLRDSQKVIQDFYAGWLLLPVELFGDMEQKKVFYLRLVESGAFRLLAMQRSKLDLCLLQLLAHPEFRGRSNDRTIIQKWLSPFRSAEDTTKVARISLHEDTDTDYKSRMSKVYRDPPVVRRGREAFENVAKQKQAIKSVLLQGKRSQAFKFIRQLIDSQQQNSEGSHRAKTLCDLAQFVKQLGDVRLQKELAKWAVQEMPTDPWTYAHLADAQRNLGEFTESLANYETVGILGDSAVGLCGKAAVFRELGQLDNSLSLFDKCILEHPNEIVAYNGRAAALADVGRLNEALNAYDAILERWPDDCVTTGGRAGVLRDLGRNEEATAVLVDLAQRFPEDEGAVGAYADILREQGNFDAALNVLESGLRKIPFSISLRNLRAKVHRDAGNTRQALTEYESIRDTFRRHTAAFIGYAETLRKQARLHEAAAAYEDGLRRFPNNIALRNGIASTYAALGFYKRSLGYLPQGDPASLSEWVSYHIGSMTLMRMGKLDEAIERFNWGIQENPWIRQRQYFQTALAVARIRQRRYGDAVSLLADLNEKSVHPISCVLRIHAYGEMGKLPEARRAFQDMPAVFPAYLSETLRLMRNVYLVATSPNRYSHRRIILDEEAKMMLLAA